MKRVLCLLAAAALLFSQLALAAYACPSPSGPPAASVPETDCCAGMRSPLCGAHCAPDAQALERHEAPQFAPAALPAITSPAPVLVAMRTALPQVAPPRVLAPPGRARDLLHSRLRI